MDTEVYFIKNQQPLLLKITTTSQCTQKSFCGKKNDEVNGKIYLFMNTQGNRI